MARRLLACQMLVQFMGKLLTSPSSCKTGSLHYRLNFAETPEARFSQELRLQANMERNDQISRALQAESQNCWFWVLAAPRLQMW